MIIFFFFCVEENNDEVQIVEKYLHQTGSVYWRMILPFSLKVACPK